MLSTICSAKQKSLQMCAELRHCQRWVTNRERQRVPQWRTRDEKTSLSISRRLWSKYCQIAAWCRSEMTSASGGRNRVARHCKVDWCRLVRHLKISRQILYSKRCWMGSQRSRSRMSLLMWSYYRLCSISRAAAFSTFCSSRIWAARAP